MLLIRFRIVLFLVVSLGLLQNVRGQGRYQLADDGKTHVWNSSPRFDQLPVWEGERDSKGYATGHGTLTWYRVERSMVTGSNLPSAPNRRVLISKLSGSMEDGKFVGPVEMLNANGKTYHATFAGGNISGDWESGTAPVAGKKKKHAAVAAVTTTPALSPNEATPTPAVARRHETPAPVVAQEKPAPSVAPPPSPTPVPEQSVAMLAPSPSPLETPEAAQPSPSMSPPPPPPPPPTPAPETTATAAPITPAPSAAPSEPARIDEEGVRQVGNAFRDAWAQHDMRALGSTVAANVDFVATDGTKARSRAELEKYNARPTADRVVNSSGAPSEAEVRSLGANAAEVSWRWTVRAQLNPDGTLKPRHSGLTTLKVEKRGGKWVVTSAKNTNSTTTATDLAEPQPPAPSKP